MSAKKIYLLYLIIIICLLPRMTISLTTPYEENPDEPTPTLARDTLTKVLGWVESDETQCGGYYLEEPFIYPDQVEKNNSIMITSTQGFYAQRGTSILEENVTVTRGQQQMTGNKAFLYRDPTGKLSAIDMIGDVHLREPNTLIIGKKGRYDFESDTKSLMNIYYRTVLNSKKVVSPKIPKAELQKERKITALTAWGRASEISSKEPKVYELYRCSFSTCSPVDPAWQIKASHIELDKNTGRGYATHARVLVKKVPIFYIPYINFSIDNQRKSGFLWPSVGLASNKWGPYFLAPFYWNMAANYDMVITPGWLSKRGFQLSDTFRYLSHTSSGKLNGSVLIHDKFFANYQKKAEENPQSVDPHPDQPASVTQAEINRLINASTIRRGFSWRDNSRFNENWSSHLDFNYASDDYYLRDFGKNLNEITINQLLQEADLYYSSQNWNFTGRLQSYQTLHPVNERFVANQYRRLPQLILNADYPNQAFGLEYFLISEVTHFDILKDPGIKTIKPIGNRLHLQPGVSLPLSWPFFYFTPRIQLALTEYNLHQVGSTHTPSNKQRTLPIFDLASGLAFTREISLFNHLFQQTLEPQAYYTYIPYRNQNSIPIFDTTVNTLVYDQIFNYNRFSGIDRIGDANQIGVGVTSRLLDEESGFEKVRLGLGEIFYFAHRRVTLCNDESCTDNPKNSNNHRPLSPLSAFLNYNMSPFWSLQANAIWNPATRLMDNATLGLHYQTDERHILNLSYSFARNYDILSGVVVNTGKNNISATDFSFVWPLFHDFTAVGRWTQDWRRDHFQSLLYGLQYDTCCWAVRLVGGKTFTNLVNNTPQYRSQFYVQFDLKGLGNIGSDPSRLLSSITGYNTQFGKEL